MPIQIANNARGSLAANLAANAVTATVQDYDEFPTIGSGTDDYFYITVFKNDGTQEIVKVTATNGNSWTIVRGQDGTTGTIFSSGDHIELRMNKAAFTEAAEVSSRSMSIDYDPATSQVNTGDTTELIKVRTYTTDFDTHEAIPEATSVKSRIYYNEYDDMHLASMGFHDDVSSTDSDKYIMQYGKVCSTRSSGIVKRLAGLWVDGKFTAPSFADTDVVTENDELLGIHGSAQHSSSQHSSSVIGVRGTTYAFGFDSTGIDIDTGTGVWGEFNTFSAGKTTTDARGGHFRIRHKYGAITNGTCVSAEYSNINQSGATLATNGYLFKGSYVTEEVVDADADNAVANPLPDNSYGIHLTGDVYNKIDGKLGIGVTPTATSPVLEVKGQVELHWSSNSESSDASVVGVQTRRLQTTDRGIHIGDDLTGTITSGDLQNNSDVDFGVLIGRDSTNLGSNNFGQGYQMYFGANTASNWATGSQCKFYGASTNSMAHGGNIIVGDADDSNVAANSCFVGGTLTQATGDYSFTWAKGVVQSSTDVIVRAENHADGGVLFGVETKIDSGSHYSLVGGRIGNSPSYNKTEAQNSVASLVWGRGCRTLSSSFSINTGTENLVQSAQGSACFGGSHLVQANYSFAAGYNHDIGTDSINSCAIGEDHDIDNKWSAAIGKNNHTEGDGAMAFGVNCNAIGFGAVCAGSDLKTPLFQPVVDVDGTLTEQGDYVWDNFSTVVGGFNDEAHKYPTVYPTDGSLPTAWVTDHRFVVGTGTASDNKANGFIVAVATDDFSGIIMPALAASNAHASMSDAKDAGVPVGGLYRDTNNNIKIVV